MSLETKITKKLYRNRLEIVYKILDSIPQYNYKSVTKNHLMYILQMPTNQFMPYLEFLQKLDCITVVKEIDGKVGKQIMITEKGHAVLQKIRTLHEFCPLENFNSSVPYYGRERRRQTIKNYNDKKRLLQQQQ